MHSYGLKAISPEKSFRPFMLASGKTLDVPDTDLTKDFDAAGISHKDQGDVGCCVFASGATCLEFLTYRQTQKPLAGFQYSMYFPYYFAREMYVESGDIKSIDVDSGSTGEDFFKVTEKYGVCHERTWKSVRENFSVRPSSAAIMEASGYQALEGLAIRGNSATLIRAALYHNKLPVQVGILVPPELESEKVSKTGILDTISDYTLSNNLGGHEVVVSGSVTIDGHKWFRIRNSWGSDWGKDGDFYIPQTLFSKLCVEARVINRME